MPALIHARSHRALARPMHLVRSALHRWAQHRSAQGLLKLDDHLLRDIGLTRAEAEAEAARAAWNAPLHWRA